MVTPGIEQGRHGQSPLVLEDIEDLRAYERGRDAFRRSIIELKKRRRVAVGPFMTVLFENRETVRFQIQEMARVERMATDDQIQGELDVYNALLPSAGELSATMFIELTDEASTAGMAPQTGRGRADARAEIRFRRRWEPRRRRYRPRPCPKRATNRP